MIQNQSTYESYLLRLWQVRQDGKSVWRASLESTRTGTRENFADLQQAFAFLCTALQGDQDKMPPRRKKTSAPKRSG
ncbi:MAG: hypothetical protein AB1817_11390 [Chloroflexota bacterium]